MRKNRRRYAVVVSPVGIEAHAKVPRSDAVHIYRSTYKSDNQQNNPDAPSLKHVVRSQLCVSSSLLSLVCSATLASLFSCHRGSPLIPCTLINTCPDDT